jgi:hypothetical protein
MKTKLTELAPLGAAPPTPQTANSVGGKKKQKRQSISDRMEKLTGRRL